MLIHFHKTVEGLWIAVDHRSLLYGTNPECAALLMDPTGTKGQTTAKCGSNSAGNISIRKQWGISL